MALTTEDSKKKEKRKHNPDHLPSLIHVYLINWPPSPGSPSVHLPYTRLVHFTTSPSLLVNPPYSFGKIITFPYWFAFAQIPLWSWKYKYINGQLIDICRFIYKKKKRKKKGGDENTNKYIYLYTTINQKVKHGKGEINK